MPPRLRICHRSEERSVTLPKVDMRKCRSGQKQHSVKVTCEYLNDCVFKCHFSGLKINKADQGHGQPYLF